MSSPTDGPTRTDRIRMLVQQAVDAGANISEAASAAGYESRQALYNFLEGASPSEERLDKLERWVQLRWEATQDERQSVAELLRWMAEIVEAGAPIPKIRLSQLSREQDGLPQSGSTKLSKNDGGGAASGN